MGVVAIRVLLVDDDAQIRRLFRTILEPGGFTVLEAASVKEALKLLNAAPVDLVILELSMPAADGFDVLKFMTKNLPAIPSLVVSGVGEPVLRMAKHLGATAVLDKPDAPFYLLSMARKLLGKKRGGSVLGAGN